MDANTIKQQFPGYSGWNDPAAILADFKATGGAGKGGQAQTAPGATAGASGGDVTAIARQMLGFQQEAVRPAVQQLEAQKQPLQDRYKAVLESLKGKEQQETAQAQTALSREYGQRGIPLSSGMFQEALMQKTRPISQAYAGLTAETGLQQQQSLVDLATKIAQLQSGGISDIYSQARQQYEGEQERTMQERAYQDIALPQAQATLAKLRSQMGGDTVSGNTDPFGLR